MESLSQQGREPQESSLWFHVFRKRKVIFSACWGLYVALFLGLFSGVGIGIADNGDGVRVTAPAGLNPQTDSGLTKGQGYVVTEFLSAANRSPASVVDRMTSLHYPTANSYVLTLMGVLSPDRSVSLFALGWVYLLVGLTIIWLAPIRKNPLPTLIVMGVLVLAPFARWMTSAYADTPAFFGFAAVLVSLVALLSHLNSREFLRVNVLFWWGVLLISLSKAAYAVVIPLIVLSFAIALIVLHRGKLKGSQLARILAVTVSGLALIGGMLVVQFGSSDRQQSNTINNHHFVMSVVVPNYPTEVVENVIPETLRDLSPEGYWPRTGNWRDVAGWEETMTDTALVTELRLALFAQPALLWELMSKAVSRSTTPELDYLVPNTWLPDDPPILSVLPWALYLSTTWLTNLLLSPLSVSWLAIPFLIVTVIGALVLVIFRNSTRPKSQSVESRTLLALMIFSGVLAGALAGVAILGDGFTELEKHLIMTSFLFTVFSVSAIALVGREILNMIKPLPFSWKKLRLEK